jgi:hypothetical protein
MDKYTLAKFIAASYTHGAKKLPQGWSVVTDSNQLKLSKDGFYGITLKNDTTKEVVVAFSGTSFDKPWEGGLLGDMKSNYQILIKHEVPTQYESAKQFALESMKMIPDIEAQDITLTGHSLGAVLSDLTTYELKLAGFDNVHAVNFDNPGSKPIIEQMLRTHDTSINDVEVRIEQYESKPTIINTWHSQVGEVFEVDFRPDGLINKALTLASYIDYTGIAITIQQHYFSNWLGYAFNKGTGDVVNSAHHFDTSHGQQPELTAEPSLPSESCEVIS